ncbi:hypothetical protein [Ferrovum sp.]|uniref:hypothetical protein n=1 Tax=Ferrovum sp. TaxID=2609467 RepID=UPI0026351628|nr:hypothetical protein [Ferrovum sp.]
MRLGKTQKLIIWRMLREGGEHVFIGPTRTHGQDLFGGCFWEKVERSLAALVRRGIVVEKKRGFYSLPSDCIKRLDSHKAGVL